MADVSEQLQEIKNLNRKRALVLRESWVALMEARITREALQKCWREEGVNHYESCAELAQKYQKMIRENRVEGFRKLDFES